jgi:hypothetical protein
MSVRGEQKRPSDALVAVLVVLLIGSTATYGRTRDLSVDEARRLVIQALYPTQRNLRGLDVGFTQSAKIPGFYRFDVIWDNPDPGSVVVGAFAVNQATGDVWELALCRRKRSRDLARLQQDLRKAIGLTADELRKLRDETPCEP